MVALDNEISAGLQSILLSEHTLGGNEEAVSAPCTPTSAAPSNQDPVSLDEEDQVPWVSQLHIRVCACVTAPVQQYGMVLVLCFGAALVTLVQVTHSALSDSCMC